MGGERQKAGEVSSFANGSMESIVKVSNWTGWPGGECPVTADTTVEILTRGGTVSKGLAREFMWSHDPNVVNYGDIVGYRLECADE